MNKTKENIASAENLVPGSLTPQEIENFRLNFIKRKEAAERIISDLESHQDKEEEFVGDDDRATRSSHEIANGPGKQKSLLNARQTVKNCENALLRIKNGVFGKCYLTGEPIPRLLLEANPFRTRLKVEQEPLKKR